MPGSRSSRGTCSLSGIVHGGVYATLAESICSAATYGAVRDDGMVAMGQSNDTTFLRPIGEGHVNATARTRHRGRTTWIWDVEMSDDEGRVCALSRMTIAVRPRRASGGALRIEPKRLVIGRRRSRPKALVDDPDPGRSLAALVLGPVDQPDDLLDVSSGRPCATRLDALVALDVGLEDPVEHLVGRQGVLVELVGPQLRRGRRAPAPRRGPARARPARCASATSP